MAKWKSTNGQTMICKTLPRKLNDFTRVLESKDTHGEVYLMQHYVIKFVSYLWQSRWSSLTVTGLVVISEYWGFLRHDKTEILLKVAWNTITLIISIGILHKENVRKIKNQYLKKLIKIKTIQIMGILLGNG
jgi:hypothetical protein